MTSPPETVHPEALPDPVRGWRAAFPPAQWLPAYRSQWLARDAIAGITLAAYGIPVSLAYASLAGLPPQHGVYGYLVGGACYALFGSSRRLAIGPTSAISMLVGVTVAGMAGGDVARAVDIAALAALLVAGMCLVAWLLRLSHLVSFISESVLVGFKAGAALTIAMTQLPTLLGVPGGGDGFFARAAVLWQQLPETSIPVLAFGLAALAFIWLGERFLPGKPMALIVVAVSIVLLAWTPLAAMGFALVGAVPHGLPALHLAPLRLDDVAAVAPLAFACVLLAYVESVSAARSLAGLHDEAIDVRQEFLGLGAANAGAALFQAYPVAGGLSQSSVNDQAGAKTPLALLFASVTIGLCLAYLTGLLADLPKVVLAAIVLVAVKGLVDVAEMRRLWRVSRTEFVISVVAFGAVLLLGILEGVLVGVLVSLGLIIQRTARPHVAFLGRIGETRNFGDMARHPENTPVPGVLAFRVEAALLYFNAEHVHETVLARVRRTPGVRLVVYDVSSSPVVDLAGARMLATLERELAAAGIALRFAGAHAPVRDMLRAVGLEQRVGPFGRGVTVAQAIDKFLEPDAVR
jgi:high affinity sulfate transporter 1